MTRFTALMQDFGADQNGATAIEYGFVACLISLTIIVAATQIGQALLGFFQAAAEGLVP